MMSGRFPIGPAQAPAQRVPKAQALVQVEQGACMLCMKTGHYAAACPAGNEQACKDFMDEFRRLRKAVNK